MTPQQITQRLAKLHAELARIDGVPGTERLGRKIGTKIGNLERKLAGARLTETIHSIAAVAKSSMGGEQAESELVTIIGTALMNLNTIRSLRHERIYELRLV